MALRVQDPLAQRALDDLSGQIASLTARIVALEGKLQGLTEDIDYKDSASGNRIMHVRDGIIKSERAS